jgi:miniconductance mechanosensitive channel
MEQADIGHWAQNFFEQIGADPSTAERLTLGLDLLIILLISFSADRIARYGISRMVKKIISRTKNEWDDIFYEQKVFNGLAHIVPALIINWSTDFALSDFPEVVALIDQWVVIYVIFLIGLVINRVLGAIKILLKQSEYFEGKPVGSFIQLFGIVNYIFVGIFILSQLIGESPLTVIGAFGAGTAILLLVFKDTILGLVASIQLSMNDMVRVGDWISMDKYGADGDVSEINLTTVKVKNFDKTITTIPTYAFVSDSFKNWRGMSTDGVRRIKRHLLIDVHSIRFVDDALKNEMERFQIISAQISTKQAEIDSYNTEQNADKQIMLNGRNMTNIGAFRTYATEYIRNNPQITEAETLMVRQLQPTEKGLPLELYCFTNTSAWLEYEGILSDIFDHLMAAAPFFGLMVYQAPSGGDLRQLGASKAD